MPGREWRVDRLDFVFASSIGVSGAALGALTS